MSYSSSGWGFGDMRPNLGWQCPICRHVYSPTTPQCYVCPNGSYTNPQCTSTGTKTVSDGKIHKITTSGDFPRDYSL